MDCDLVPHLRPLPECEIALMALRELGVDSDCPIGWAPACVALATTVHAVRPGVQLRLRLSGDFIQVHADGGAVIAADNLLDPQMSAWILADRTAALTCGNCGRPGLRRVVSEPAICDACSYLRTTPDDELPFIPALPLPDETLAAVNALGELGNQERLTELLVGWTRLVHSTLRDITTAAIRDTFTFTVHDDTVSIAFDDEAFPLLPELLALNERLEVNARVHCRRCSRRLLTDPGDPAHDSVCSGCRWVESRGWEVVDADRVTVRPFMQEELP
jgi:hypothetical protein